MIERKEVAKEISDLMLEMGRKLDASVALVQERCGAREFDAYRRAVGRIMGEMLLQVMNPLYQRHPELKPEKLR